MCKCWLEPPERQRDPVMGNPKKARGGAKNKRKNASKAAAPEEDIMALDDGQV